MKKYFVAALAALMISPAFAGGSHHTPPPKPTTSDSVNEVTSVSSANSNAEATGVGIAGAKATGGKANASASGGKASADSENTNVNGQDQGQLQGQKQSANNEGNAQSTTINTKVERSAPAAVQGSIAISGCSVGGNAGGSNVGGAGFLGLAFTPPECYAFALAQAYQAVGEQKTACLVLNSTNAAKRAVKRGVTLPSCKPFVAEVTPQVTGDTTEFVTRPELAEHERRIVGAVVGK